MDRRALKAVILCCAVSLLPGCLTTVHIDAAQPNARVRLLQADQETVWTALLQLLEARNIRIIGMNRDRGWLQTDFVYFRPMDFGEPVLAGKMIMGNYLDVQGGRYRLVIQLVAAGAATSVRVEANVERLEQRVAQAPPIEPSFSLDAPMRRNYLVQVPQPSNGVIERHFLGEMEQAVTDMGTSPDPPRLSRQ
jgi:hypothetical protein